MEPSGFSGLTLLTPPALEPVTIADVKNHARTSNDLDDTAILGYIVAARVYCEGVTHRAFLPQTWRLALQFWPGRDYRANTPHQVSTTSDYYRNNFIPLPRPPLRSVDSITYQDTTGASYTLTQGATADYLVDTYSEPGRIVLPFGQVWPTRTLLPGSAIQIQYQAGYDKFQGTVNIGPDGEVDLVSGDSFQPFLAGSYINIGGVSYTVQQYTNASKLFLSTSPAVAATAATNQPYQASALPMNYVQAILMLAAHWYENREAMVVGRTSQIATEIKWSVDTLLDVDRNFS